MDERQSKIIEGAGLEESRLNTDFIRWLQKWGSPLLLLLCVLAGGYAAWNWYQRSQLKAYNEAYAQLTAAQAAGSPDGLLRVAREHKGRGSVSQIATLSAADVYLSSAMTRIAPGGKPGNETDKLNDEQRKANLEQAKNLYAEVLADAGSDKGHAIIAMNARFGLNAAAASLGDIAGAQKSLDEIAEAARAANIPGKAEEAQRIKADLGRVASLPPLRTKAEVAASARPRPAVPEPDPTASPPLGFPGPAPEQGPLLEPIAPPVDPAVPPPGEPAPTPAPTTP